MSAGRVRPFWRWWLFCLGCELHFRMRDGSRLHRLGGYLIGWAPLPAWFGAEDVPATAWDGEVPF